MVKRNLILTGIICVFLCACTKTNNQSDYPVVNEMIDGVKVVMNPEFPRDGKGRYALEEELTIGAGEQDENANLNRPFSIRVTDEGMIYVMDWGDICIKVYDSQGQFIRKIGRSGQGPGEFAGGARFTVGRDGRIYVADPRNSRVMIFDPEGEFLKSIKLEGGFFADICVDNDDSLFLSRDFVDKEGMKMSIHRYDIDGIEQHNYGDFQVPQAVTRKTDSGLTISTISRIAPDTVWTVNPTGRLYVGFGDTFLINVLDQDGSPVFKFGRKYTPIPNTKYADQPHQPEFIGIFNVSTRYWLFDEDGNMWIENPQEEYTDNYIYDIFSPEGIYLKQASLRFRLFEMKKGKGYTIVEDDEGFRVVKKLKLGEAPSQNGGSH